MKLRQYPQLSQYDELFVFDPTLGAGFAADVIPCSAAGKGSWRSFLGDFRTFRRDREAQKSAKTAR